MKPKPKRRRRIYRPKDQYAMHAYGLDVTVYRSLIDNRIVIELDTSGLEGDDVLDTGAPNLVLYVNDERNEVLPDGGWKVTQGED